jgi:hypothetical protein
MSYPLNLAHMLPLAPRPQHAAAAPTDRKSKHHFPTACLWPASGGGRGPLAAPATPPARDSCLLERLATRRGAALRSLDMPLRMGEGESLRGLLVPGPRDGPAGKAEGGAPTARWRPLAAMPRSKAWPGHFQDALTYANAALRNFQAFGARAAEDIERTQRLIAQIEQARNAQGD